MRILVTNDDGVDAPGIAALAAGIHDRFGAEHEVRVVAPLRDFSGASGAVGRVYEREAIPFEARALEGAPGVVAFGVDGTPALAVVLACIEAFGARPDLIVSGVNLGANVGRSAFHSGTIGAALTGSQFGIRGLAVSTTWCAEPVPWETPVGLACRVIPALLAAPPATVMSLNTPSVPLDEVKGIARASLARSGLIRSAERSDGEVDNPEGAIEVTTGDPKPGVHGSVTLRLRGAGFDRSVAGTVDPGSDVGLITEGWATITPLTGVREATDGDTDGAVEAALEMTGLPTQIRHH